MDTKHKLRDSGWHIKSLNKNTKDKRNEKTNNMYH